MQFDLRTLLAVVAYAAVVLAIIASARNRGDVAALAGVLTLGLLFLFACDRALRR